MKDDPFSFLDDSEEAKAAPVSPVAPVEPVAKKQDPFAFLDSPTAEQDVQPKATAGSTILHGVERGAAPAAGAILGGAAAMGAAGALVGGPIGGLAGLGIGIVGGLAGGYAATAGQEYALSKVSEDTKKKFGQDTEQRQAEQEAYPVLSMASELAPFALTLSPMGVAKVAAPAGATVYERVAAAAAGGIGGRATSGVIMGGLEGFQESFSPEGVNLKKVGVATAFGLLFPGQNAIGERIGGFGHMVGESIVPGTVREAAANRYAQRYGKNATEASPDDVNWADVANTVPDHPTYRESADQNIGGLGITEEGFHGQETISPVADKINKAQRSEEIAALGLNDRKPDIEARARQSEPELFDKYDTLQAQIAEKRKELDEFRNPSEETIADAKKHKADLEEQLRSHIEDRSGYKSGPEARRLRALIGEADRNIQTLTERPTAGVETPESLAARQQVIDLTHQLWDVSRDVSRARRHAADYHGGEDVIEPSRSEGEGTPSTSQSEALPTSQSEAPTPVPANAQPAPAVRSNAEQRASIEADIARQLTAANARAGGKVTPDQVAMSAKLDAAFFTTLSERFKGKIGTPEELYAKHGAQIVAQGAPVGRAATPKASPKVSERPAVEEPLIVNGQKYSGRVAEILRAKLAKTPEENVTSLAPPEWKPGETVSVGPIANMKVVGKVGDDYVMTSRGAVYRVEAGKPDFDGLHRLNGDEAAEMFKRAGGVDPVAAPVEKTKFKEELKAADIEPAEISDDLTHRAEATGETEPDVAHEVAATAREYEEPETRVFARNRYGAHKVESVPAEHAQSLLTYLQKQGGLKDSPELRNIFGKGQTSMFGKNRLVHNGKDAMSLDEALRTAVDAGYLHDSGKHGGELKLEVNNLLDLIREDAGGRKVYPEGGSPKDIANSRAYDRQTNEINAAEKHIRDEIKFGDEHEPPPDGVWLDAAKHMVLGGEPDPYRAFDLAMVDYEREHSGGGHEVHGRATLGDGGRLGGAGGKNSRPGEEGQLRDEGTGFAGVGETGGAQGRETELAQDGDGLDLFQDINAKILLRPGKNNLITMARTADASSFAHEASHNYTDILFEYAAHPDAPTELVQDLKTILDWVKVDNVSQVKRRHHEQIANGFERYLREGVAPSRELAGVFDHFRTWMMDIYKSMKDLAVAGLERAFGPDAVAKMTPARRIELSKQFEINDSVRGVFDRLLATDPQRVLIHPDKEMGPTHADIHEADAAHTEPHEAHAAADRIASERARMLEDAKPEVQNELPPFKPATEANEAGTAGEGQVESGAAGSGPLEGGGREREPVAGGGVSGEADAAVSGSGGASKAEGDGLSGGGQHKPVDGNPLVPGPVERFAEPEGRLVDKAANIRMENVTNDMEMREAMRESARLNDDFKTERRVENGPVTDAQVQELAEALGLSGAMRLVKNHVIGKAYNAEEITVLRNTAKRMSNDVAEAWRTFSKDESEASIEAIVKAEANLDKVMAVVTGATAEWGRAGRAFRDISNTDMSLDQKVKALTGKTLFQLRMKAKLGAEINTPEGTAQFHNDSKKWNFGRMIVEYWINGLISGLATHSTYVVGNGIITLQKAGPETFAAAAVGQVRQALGRELQPGEQTVKFGEVGAKVASAVEALPTALKAAGQAFATGRPTLLPTETPRGQAMVATNDTVHPGFIDEAYTWKQIMPDLFGAFRGMNDAVMAGAAQIAAGGVEGAPMFGAKRLPGREIPDIQYRGTTVLPLGSLANFPGRPVSAIHSFFKALNFSMEKNAWAYRTAVAEGKSGADLNYRTADLRQNVPQDVMPRLVAEGNSASLMDAAGPFVQKLQHLINQPLNLPLLGETPILKFIDPFVHISSNILKQTFLQRTPLGLLSPELRADLAGKNGPVAADTAAGRMLVGSAYALMYGSLAASGYITGAGPKEPKEADAWRRLGKQPHSVLIGDTWHQTNRLGPMGLHMSVAADLYGIAHQLEKGDMAEAAAHLHHAIAQNILDESFMRGPSDLIKAIESPGRYGEAYVRNFLSGFVPYSVGMSQWAKAIDPYSRKSRTIMDSMIAKVPYLSESLPARIDVWGEPIQSRNVAGIPGMSAIWTSVVNTDPIERELWRLKYYPGPVPKTIRNVELTPEQYDDFAGVAGKLSRKAVERLILSDAWQRMPSHVQSDRVEAQIKMARNIGRNVMFMKYPQLLRDATIAKRDALTGKDFQENE